MKRTLTAYAVFLLLLHPLWSQGLIVNEISNGLSGNREYIELVAVGPAGYENCGPVDLRGFVIDDNNGDFDTNATKLNAGITSGHFRFDSSAFWSAVPAGAILLIYYSAEKNDSILLADDPYDLNGDSVYILPDTNQHMQKCGSLPSTSTNTYAGCSYSNAFIWSSTISLRNLGDAVQVRRPGFSLFHSLSWGGTGSTMVGAGDSLQMDGDATRSVIRFVNNGSDNYRLKSNFSKDSAAVSGNQSPGRANNAANAVWIKSLRENSCMMPLPEGPELLLAFGKDVGKHSYLEWYCSATTGTIRIESQFFAGEIPELIHIEKLSPVHQSGIIQLSGDEVSKRYRLGWENEMGELSFGEWIVSNPGSMDFVCLYPNPASGKIGLGLYSKTQSQLDISIHTLQGSLLFNCMREALQGWNEWEIILPNVEPGVYLLSLNSENFRLNKAIRIF